MTPWPASYEPPQGLFSLTTVGVMLDERFKILTMAIRPSGRSIATSEISIDLAGSLPRPIRRLNSDGELLSAGLEDALAWATLRDEQDAVVATATSRCRFLPGGVDDHAGHPARPETPTDLTAASMLDINSTEAKIATFTPDARCANDFGTLHGGILTGAVLELALAWLQTRLADPVISSLRLNFLRPIPLPSVVRIRVDPTHVGRTSALARVTCHGDNGKAAASATITGAARIEHRPP